jgi:hypothetical protein
VNEDKEESRLKRWKSNAQEVHIENEESNQRRNGGKAMSKKFILIMATAAVMAFGGIAYANPIPGFTYAISYDGYLQQTTANQVIADTLIVVNNPNPFSSMPLWIEIFDKHGGLIWEGRMWDGGAPIDRVVPNGYGWITLGMVVARPTHDPFGEVGRAEKFHYRITALHPETTLRIVPTVEVKQVIYTQTPTLPPKEAIWQTTLFKSWTEAALGGSKYATGVIWTDIP